MKKIILLFIFCSHILAHANAEDFSVEAIGGADSIAIKRGKEEILLKAKDNLQIGDMIQTSKGVVVDIRFPDHSLVRVGENAQFQIDKENQDSALVKNAWMSRLLQGFVRILVPKSNDKSKIRFHVETPSGTMGVRGTEFIVGYDAKTKSTSVKTLAGEVWFGPQATPFSQIKEFVAVKKGEQSETVGSKINPPKKFSTSLLKTIDKQVKGNPFSSLSWRRTGEKIASGNSLNSASSEAKKNKVLQEPKKNVSDATQAKAPINYQEEMRLAVVEGNAKRIQELAKKGAPINQRFKTGEGYLHIAVYKLQLGSIKALIDLGADVNARNDQGLTPLMLLAKMEKPEMNIARVLAHSGTDLKLQDNEHKTVLDIAKENPYAKDLEKYLAELIKE